MFPCGECGLPLFYLRKEDSTIAIYHLSIKIVSRGKGKSAVAAAAYRSGEKITNAYDGVTHDYTRKGGVAHTEILLPDNAPQAYTDRAALWNAVEKAERNKNAQLAREIELALPVELTAEQNRELVRDYCRRNFVDAGMCADICIHDKNDGNPHAHVMLTMRPITPDGSWGAKSRKEYLLDEDGQRILLPSGAFKTTKVCTVDWNDQDKAEQWREAWAETVNAALEQNGHAERIDHRSYARQGVEQIPTIHLGVAAFQMERRGIRTQRGDLNRQVQLDNNMLRQLRARINKLKSGLDELLNPSHPIPSIPDAGASSPQGGRPASLADVLTGILEKPEETTRRKRITNLKTAAAAIIFLQQNDIRDLAGLREKVVELYTQAGDLSDRLKKAEHRLKTLDEHIQHADNYFKHKALWGQYKQQKPNKQEAFYEAHRAGLTLYEAAQRYLAGVMNGRATIPRKALRAERDRLNAEKGGLYREYVALNQQVKEADTMRRCVEQVLQDEQTRERSRERGAEL